MSVGDSSQPEQVSLPSKVKHKWLGIICCFVLYLLLLLPRYKNEELTIFSCLLFVLFPWVRWELFLPTLFLFPCWEFPQSKDYFPFWPSELSDDKNLSFPQTYHNATWMEISRTETLSLGSASRPRCQYSITGVRPKGLEHSVKAENTLRRQNYLLITDFLRDMYQTMGFLWW